MYSGNLYYVKSMQCSEIVYGLGQASKFIVDKCPVFGGTYNTCPASYNKLAVSDLQSPSLPQKSVTINMHCTLPGQGQGGRAKCTLHLNLRLTEFHFCHVQ